MKIRSEKGYTGIDIAVSVVILFIFVSIIAMLIYQVNSASRQVSLRSDAIYLAINEIEQVKINGIENYEGVSQAEGNSVVANSQPIDGTEGYYKTITIVDYADLRDDRTPDIVKKATVKISYMFQGEEQSVELSTILSKES